MAYFKKAGWEASWIEVAEEIVRNQFEGTYAEVPELNEDAGDDNRDAGDEDYEDTQDDDDDDAMSIDDAPGPSKVCECPQLKHCD